jgi:hypothetical protein
MQNYIDRLKIPISANKIKLFTFSGLLLSEEYERIVIGERGPYIEIKKLDISNLIIPEKENWRVSSNVSYYVEYRTKDISSVKIYFQKRTVDYADYKINYFYVSPFDLRINIIEKLKQISEKVV